MSKVSIYVAAFLLVSILIALGLSAVSAMPASAASPFIFASMGDGQLGIANFTETVDQINALDPDLVIFNGDLENDGVRSTEMNPMVTAIKNAGLFNQTFLVRGNHDNHVSGSAALWESYFETSPNKKTLPVGVTNYVSLDSSSDYLTYSFIYGNAMFIGLDVPGNVSLLTAAQLVFLDTRLTYAEEQSLSHAFIYFHGPLYCVESFWCACSSRTDASCTPSALVAVLNEHPIVSATFHGHEHILGWTHMDRTRISGLTGSFEQFLTSPAGGQTDNADLFAARVDYAYMNMGDLQAFATILVDGSSFTVNLYKVGTDAPVWSETFANDYHPSPTFTFTPSYTLSPTYTPSPTETDTSTSTITPSETFTPSPTLTLPGTATATLTSTSTPSFTETFTPTQTPTRIPDPYTFYLPLITNGKYLPSP